MDSVLLSWISQVLVATSRLEVLVRARRRTRDDVLGGWLAPMSIRSAHFGFWSLLEIDWHAGAGCCDAGILGFWMVLGRCLGRHLSATARRRSLAGRTLSCSGLQCRRSCSGHVGLGDGHVISVAVLSIHGVARRHRCRNICTQRKLLSPAGDGFWRTAAGR